MAKTQQLVEVSVHADVEQDGWLDPRWDDPKLVAIMRERGDRIVREIRRHVDGVRNVRLALVTRDICEHCGYGWEIDDEEGSEGFGLPVCCDKAIGEAIRERTAAS